MKLKSSTLLFLKNLSGAINSSDVESGYKRMRFKESRKCYELE
jgi:hypothetical protein